MLRRICHCRTWTLPDNIFSRTQFELSFKILVVISEKPRRANYVSVEVHVSGCKTKQGSVNLSLKRKIGMKNLNIVVKWRYGKH